MKLKDMLNQESVAALAAAMQRTYPAFDREAFLTRVFDGSWPDREFKQRVRHITTCLDGFLPSGYGAALDVLRGALPLLPEWSFEHLAFPDYVEVYGLDDWEASIAALEEFTQVVTAEYAIRPFIARYPKRTMAQMLRWAGHENAQVRRLASEGCRPRLPWGIRLSGLQADPSPILLVLQQLRHDPSESVRRSVANNLNDISKDNPDVVVEVLRQWQADGNDGIRWIARHALRTLLKQGHPPALELLGYPIQPAIAVRNLTVQPGTVPMGGELAFSFEIESLGKQAQKLMIDYVLYSTKANGELSPKVWKLTKRTIQPGQVLPISGKHSFRPVTTRKQYAGDHAIQPKINGLEFECVRFILIERKEEVRNEHG